MSWTLAQNRTDVVFQRHAQDLISSMFRNTEDLILFLRDFNLREFREEYKFANLKIIIIIALLKKKRKFANSKFVKVPKSKIRENSNTRKLQIYSEQIVLYHEENFVVGLQAYKIISGLSHFRDVYYAYHRFFEKIQFIFVDFYSTLAYRAY